MTEAARSSRPGVPRDRIGDLHLRLMAARACVGWIPTFVANRVRTRALRAAGIEIGFATMFFGMPTLVGTGKIHGRLRVGSYCGFNEGTLFDLEESITIGDHVAVGHDVLFLTRTYAPGSSEQRAGERRAAPIVIGDGAWLGARSTILPGVTVGAGSVVGAGVAVTADVPDNTLMASTQKVSLARWR